MSNLNNETVISLAKKFGFDLIGFSRAELLTDEIEKLNNWLDKGYQASMNYMERNLQKRTDVSQILPGAKSVISLAVNYYTDHEYSGNKQKGKISRYAWGKDYHLVIWEMLAAFELQLKELESSLEMVSYVDTGPVMDKVWAVRSGLGWMGKHTNVINKDIGSWIFLANIITNYDFNYSEIIPDHCGTCTACIDACPTNAIVNEYVVDSNKCISFLTIENRDEISPEFDGKFDNWLFGCDICQDVCPWNIKFSEQSYHQDFHPLNDETELVLGNILKMSDSEFKERFAISPVKRTKFNGLKRNAEFLLK